MCKYKREFLSSICGIRFLLLLLFCLLVLICYLPKSAKAQTIGTLSQQKISDTEGNFTGILSDDGKFGRAITSLGDLDGDGITDIAVGAPLDDDGGGNRGAVWVLFLNQDGTVKSQQKISDTEGNFTGTLVDFDNFGFSLTSLGDLDGDGIADIAVGTPLDDDGDEDRGAVWVLFLNQDGTVKSQQKISDTEGNFTGTLVDADFFGFSVTSLGDLDGDGIADIAVGSPLDDDGGENRGAVWVLFLNQNGTVKSQQKISDTEGNFTSSLADLDNFSFGITSLGDIDGDGITDIAVGVPLDDDGGEDRGAVWVLFLNQNGTVKSQQKISDTEGNFTGTLVDFDVFGVSITPLGDIDGDSITDIAVGASFDDDGGSNKGAVWVLFLNQDGTVKSQQKISDTEGNFTGTINDNDQFGTAISSIGDLDSNGITDIAVNASLDDDGGIDKGAVWILFLTNTPVATVTPTPNVTPTSTPGGGSTPTPNVTPTSTPGGGGGGSTPTPNVTPTSTPGGGGGGSTPTPNVTPTSTPGGGGGGSSTPTPNVTPTSTPGGGDGGGGDGGGDDGGGGDGGGGDGGGGDGGGDDGGGGDGGGGDGGGGDGGGDGDSTPTPNASPTSTLSPEVTPTISIAPTPTGTPTIPTGTPTGSPTTTPTTITQVISSVLVSPTTATRSALNLETAIVTVLDQDGQPIPDVSVIAFAHVKRDIVTPTIAVTKDDGTAEFQFSFKAFIARGVITFVPTSVIATVTQVQRPFLERINPPIDDTPTPSEKSAAEAVSSLIVSPVSAFSKVIKHTATVTALDQNGQPMPNVTIIADKNGNVVNVTPPTAITTSDGTAEFQFRFRSLRANKVITFMPENLTATISQTQKEFFDR